MRKLAPMLALLVVGVALAADPVTVTLSDESDAKVALAAAQACADACNTAKVFRARLAQAEAEEARAKDTRAQVLAGLAAKLGVAGKSFSVRVTRTVDGDGAEVKTVVLVATQE